MAVRSTTDAGEDDEEPAVAVTAHSTSDDRSVFVESGNCDGWIATDLTVDCVR